MHLKRRLELLIQEINKKSPRHKNLNIRSVFRKNYKTVIYPGNCLNLLRQIPDESIQLIVTSPPYNIGKEYENKLKLDIYIQQQTQVIKECVRVLSKKGSLCWQVGNYVNKSSIVPLDIALNPIFTSFNLKNEKSDCLAF